MLLRYTVVEMTVTAVSSTKSNSGNLVGINNTLVIFGTETLTLAITAG